MVQYIRSFGLYEVRLIFRYLKQRIIQNVKGFNITALIISRSMEAEIKEK